MTPLSFRRRPVALDEARRRFFSRLKAACGDRRLVVWGAGRAGEIAITLLRAEQCEPAWVADRDARRHGSHIAGLPIGSPDDLRGPASEFVVLASMYSPAMESELQSRGWQREEHYCVFPAASIYQPEFGFLLSEFRAGDRCVGVEELPGNPPRVTVMASSCGNFFFRELRDFLVHGLRSIGWEATAADETVEHVSGVPVVVGPHEFFSIGEGADWFSHESLSAAVLINTEQPQSLWFRAFGPVFDAAGAVVDISPNGAAALSAQGMDAVWMPLGWYAGCDPFDRLPEGLQSPRGHSVSLPSGVLREDADDWDGRPIDVLFVGSHSPRREQVLAELKEKLPTLKWFTHMPSDRVPLGEGGVHVDAATFVALSRLSKVLLNIHRDDAAFWEWQRIVWRGLWQRTLVVTESTGIAASPLEAGRDFVEVEVADMADTLQSLLQGGPLSARADNIRNSGWRVARTEFPFSLTAEVLARACSKVSHRER